jgi:hypothetical protein
LVGGIGRLKALTITRMFKRGYYARGGGLYLQVGSTGNKSWVFRFRNRTEGRLRQMGLAHCKLFLWQKPVRRRLRSTLNRWSNSTLNYALNSPNCFYDGQITQRSLLYQKIAA